MDVKSAYLNAPIDVELYMNQPEGYEHYEGNEKLVYRSRKSLYGLKQSTNNWHEVLGKFFLNNGCKQVKADPCIFTNFSENKILMYLVWVDHIIILANSESAMNYGKEILKGEFKMKDLGEISYFLGI